MAFDISSDHLIFDGLKPVQIIQAGTSRRQRIINVLSFGVSARDAISSDGTYSQGDLKFTIPANECFFIPQPGDFLLQEDKEKTLWSIGIVETLTLGTRYQPWCKKVSIRPETSTDLKIYKVDFKKDRTGASSPRPKLWKETTGHINELASEIEVESGGSQYGRRRIKLKHQIFISEPLDIQAGWIVKDKTGNTWNIHRVTNKASMGVATTLDVEKSRSPLVD